MKKLVLTCVFFLIMIIPLLIPSSFGITQSKTTNASGLFDLDLLSIQADYSINFDIIVPSEIEAGDTVEIIIIPKSGTVTFDVTLLGERLGRFPTNMELGQEESFGIPGGYGVGVFVQSNAHMQPLVSGPAQIISSNPLLFFDSMSAKTFQVSVSNNIGNSNSITIKLPMMLVTEIGANLDLVLIKQNLASESFQLNTSPEISLKIPLKKVYSTNLSLEVRDGTCSECIQVKPNLTYDGGQKLQSTQINISVDGRSSQSGLTSNQWSWNFSPGTGQHTIKADFYGQKSSSNSAVSYTSSSDSESFTVKKKTTSTSTTTQSSSGQGLTCGSGTHEENGECKADRDSGGGCLIATAAFGSELAPQVQQLRELRDNHLLQTETGASFMNTFNDVYYSFSPIIADYERENTVFREMVKIAITPMISSLSILNYVDMDSEAEVLGYGISLILLNIGMYVGIPAVVIVGIRKKF